MITVIKGKNSGEFAEKYTAGLEGGKYYIASMRVKTDADKANVEKHRARREGMGFMTIEQDVAIVKAIDKIKWTESLLGTPERRVALIEDLPTLCANEMFLENHEYVQHKDVENTILFGIAFLKEFFDDIIIVTEDNPDIIDYNRDVSGEEAISEFVAAMKELNAAVSKFGEAVEWA